MTLEESVSQFVKDKSEYYQQWMYDEPIVISQSYNNRLSDLHKIMFQLVNHFVNNYDKYDHLMPLEDDVRDLLDDSKELPYRIGTYRTDFVFDESGHAKIIEITCRFALNGMFLSALMNKVGIDCFRNMTSNIQVDDRYSRIYQHLIDNYLCDVSNIYILKGEDQRNESKIYQSIFENAGYNCYPIKYSEIGNEVQYFKNELIISELSFDEILSLPKETTKSLMSLNLINDFRTVFLIHDKRFFSVIGNSDFLKDALSLEDVTLFGDFYIPSFSFQQNGFDLTTVIENKDQWIVKHRSLGKSQSVYAGITMTPQEWDELLTQNMEDMTFQQWIPQKKVKGKIQGKVFDDFITGTLLFFDEEYFGFGDFRTSSFPVTNKVDHRKSASVILKHDKDLKTLSFVNIYN